MKRIYVLSTGALPEKIVYDIDLAKSAGFEYIDVFDASTGDKIESLMYNDAESDWETA
jgi:hypothetical protein